MAIEYTMNQKHPSPLHEPVADVLTSLNPEQKDAVITIEGPLLVLAGAGTGKTKVLTTRIAHILMQGTFPKQILAVTFTNKAAREMAERINSLAGYRAAGLWLGTFHSISAKILRQHAELVGLKSNFTIIDTNDQLRLIKQILADRNIDEKKFPAKVLAGIISRIKDRGITPEKVTAGDAVSFANGSALPLYQDYQNRLKALNAVDFDDLLLHNLTIFTKHADILANYHRQFKYILVDEYQDTNVAQYLWLRLLAQGNNSNICCVGDDDQSIYGWRGAEVENILRFEKDFPKAKVIRLERNYRSTSHILEAASGLIAKNSGRLGKTLWTEDNSGSPIKMVALWDDQQEAQYIADEIESLQLGGQPLHHCAILVRASFQTRAFEECFISRAIPYRVIGGLRFYERQEIRDVIAYLRLASQNDDDLAFERVINLPKRGIGPTTLEQIRNTSRERICSSFAAVKHLLAQEDGFKPAVKQTLSSFVQLVERWNERLADMRVPEITEIILEESGYLSMWQNDKSLEAEGRVENIKELLHALDDFETVSAFLEHVSLVMDIDTANSDNMVNVMTLHAAKGLEFNTVFLPGWEEGLFPHQRAVDENGLKGLEEERRLAYVGITRAKQRATICYTANRRMYGQYQSNIPSRFLAEIPEENIEKISFINAFGYSSAPKIQKVIPSTSASKPITSSAPSPVSSVAGFLPGQRIFHQKFGYGKVTAVSGDQLDIIFEKAGHKKVIDRFVEKA